MRLEFEASVTAPPFVESVVNDRAYTTASDFDSVLKKGIAAAQAGERDHARSLLTRASAIDPSSEDVWMWLASISDYPEELLAFLNRVLDINPDNARAQEWRTATRSLMAKTFVQRAVAAHEEGSHEMAVEFLDQALANDPACESAWYWKGAYSTDDDERSHLFAKVLEINPANTDAQAALEDIRQKRLHAKFEEAKWAAVAGDRAKAIADVDEFLASVPDHVEAWVFRSHIAESMDEKLHSLKKALEIDPENAAARSSHDFLVTTFGSPQKEMSEDAHREAEFATQPTAESVRLEAPVEQEVVDEFSPEDAVEPAQPTFDGFSTLETDFSAAPSEEPEPADNPFASVAAETLEGAPQAESFAAAEEPVSQDSESPFASFAADEEETPEAAAEPEAAPTAFDSWMAPMPEAAPETAHEPVNPESHESHSVFAPIDEFASPTSETVEYRPSEPTPEFSAPAAEFESAPVTQTVVLEPAAAEFRPTGTECPFCASTNDAQAFECAQCRSVLTISDVESLLASRSVDRDAVQQTVSKMEAEQAGREFSEDEFTKLGIGHFNLGNLDAGFRYLQEASRRNPNNVILSGQVNSLAIRLDEIRRQTEVHDSMPKGRTILVVDDSPTVRKLISGKLEKSGHQVVCAVDGVEALERLAEGLPDLVLLDITMPRMDGYEVCKQIRANPSARDLPVVMISGKDGFFDKVRGRMAGTTGYVTKPFGPETLMKALEMYLLPETQTVN